MKISNTYNPVSYKAEYIQPAMVKKFNKTTQEYLPEALSLVEMKPYDVNDVMAISDIARYWAYELYASNIAYDITLLFRNTPKKVTSKFYAITEQNENLDILDSNKILGVVETKDIAPGEMEIKYIQTKPSLIYSLQNPEYKGIGSMFINYFKNLKRINKIILTSRQTQAAHNFYKKNGFTEFETSKFEYTKG